MRCRPAVTLIEVLVSLFIMAIGMLALLTLFPLGAINMAQALKDDRCASTAAMAENVAIAQDIRHDAQVIAAFQAFTPATTTYSGPSSAVYVDPYGYLELSAPSKTIVGGTSGITRTNLCFSVNYPGRASGPTNLSPQEVDRWFSLPDDITFLTNATPDLTSSNVQRGRRYSYAYMLRRPQAFSDKLVELSVVVYSGRPVGALAAEPIYTATGTAGTNSVTLTWAATAPSIKRGSWILDSTTNSSSNVAQGYFYRVVNIASSSATSMVVEVQSNLKADVNSVTIMDYVVEVFDKGTSWQP